MFADNVSILATARNKTDAEGATQTEVDKVLQWSKPWKLRLNKGKIEVCAFSTWSNDSKWFPNIMLHYCNMPVNNTLCFLDILLDRSLTFSANVDKINSDLSSKLRAMKVVSDSSWGWQNQR